MYKKHRKYLDCSGGLIGIWTLKQKSPKAAAAGHEHFSPYQRPERDYYHTALLPCDAFLAAFKDPLAFATMLEDKARNVMVEWPVLNYGLEPLNRVMAERYFTLYENFFKGAHNRLEKMEYEMQISTFGYTAAAKTVTTPEPIQMRDLKASLEPAKVGGRMI